jgi:hypothetical protein
MGRVTNHIIFLFIHSFIHCINPTTISDLLDGSWDMNHGGEAYQFVELVTKIRVTFS